MEEATDTKNRLFSQGSISSKSTKRFIAMCISHCLSNAGDQAKFVLLDLFWGLLQKVFSHSPDAKAIWKDVTDTAWGVSIASMMFYGTYYFPDLVTVISEVAAKGLSPRNSSKLLIILSNEVQCWQLKIELAAYVEGLFDLRNLCYWLETSRTDTPFRVGKRIDEFLSLYAGGKMKKLPSTEALIAQAINWAITTGGFAAPDANAIPPTRRTVNEIRQQVVSERPWRDRAIASVRNATLAGETNAQRQRREQREAAIRALEEAEKQDAEEAAQLAALEAEARSQADCPPLTVDEWRAHIISGVMPSITYLTERINNEAGDRFVITEFFRGARLFDPSFAKTLTRNEAFELIEKLRPFHALDGGDGCLIDLMKDGWSAYRQNAAKVVGEFDFDKDEAAILTWHYRMFLRLEEDKKDDKKRRHCRYCGSRTGKCHCHKGLHAWWCAIQLCALVMPSSGSAERVFSLLNNLYKDEQTCLLIDSILLSLYLSFNKREIIMPQAEVIGRRPLDETVIRVGSDDVTQKDMSRLDGPFVPTSKRPTDLWLNDKILAYLRHILRSNFADSCFYMFLVQQRHDNLDLRGTYDYKSVARRCANKVPGGNLLKVRASYLPVLLNENHWVGCAIVNETKEILVYNPSGRGGDNKVILNNLLRLLGDEYKRLDNGDDSEVDKCLMKWNLIDVSKHEDNDDTSGGYPCQENDYECGVFTFLFMALHSQGVPMNFCQNDVYNCCGGQGVRGRLAYLMWKANAP
ncbi:LOW QUALITY PROTEIN: hypothetical protein ACHAXR_004040 [Thalassiosira sp. AJA248-18]